MIVNSEARRFVFMPLRWQLDLLRLIAVMMESCWLTLWFIALAPGAALLPTSTVALFVFVNLLAVVMIIRVSAARGIPGKLSRWFVLGGLAAGIIFGLYVLLPINGIGNTQPLLISSFLHLKFPLLPGPMMTIAVLLIIWFRGIHVGTTIYTPARASFDLRFGVLMMIAVTLVNDAGIQANLLSFLPLFFVSGLMVSALARQASLKINREVQRASFGNRWLGFNGILALIVCGVGFLASLILAGYGLDGASRVVKGILFGIGVIIVAILTPLLYLIDAVIRLIIRAFTSVGLVFRPPNQLNQLMPPEMQGAINPANLSQYAVLFDVLRFVCIGVVVLAVVIVIFAMLRDRENGRMVEGEERENLESESLLAGLRSSLLAGLAGLQGLFGARQPDSEANARTIRRLYARLISKAAELGYSRRLHETPYEYQAQLGVAFPGFASEIALVTRAYVNVHYGEFSDEPGEVEAVQNAVQRMIASAEEREKAQRERRGSV